jgi:hypothetical protein
LTEYPAIPLLAFGLLGFLGSLLSLLLTETSGKPLQDDMKPDAEKIIPNKGKVTPEKIGNASKPIVRAGFGNVDKPIIDHLMESRNEYCSYNTKETVYKYGDVTAKSRARYDGDKRIRRSNRS